MPESRPRILLGVTGGIAAYKASELVRALAKQGAEVQVILTQSAEEFVTPLTLATLSENPIHRSEFADPAPAKIGHIELARWADALVVAPATANTLARFGRGLADDLLSTVYLAFDGPVVVAPAMNPRMWDHAETRENLLRLSHRGVDVVEPDEGLMACGDEGSGRLADVGLICERAMLAAFRSHSLDGAHVLVTAGPTYEPIDPVRFVGNRSSGKMGCAVAAAARARGAKVTLIAGPVSVAPPFGVDVQRVMTAAQMRDMTLSAAQRADIVVMAAAVADHRPATASEKKLGHKNEPYELSMVPNPDILAELVQARRPEQLIVGFAAETHDAVERGRAKRERKGCDLIVVNDVSAEGAGFEVDTNIVTLIDDAETTSFGKLAKREVAERLLDRVEALTGRFA